MLACKEEAAAHYGSFIHLCSWHTPKLSEMVSANHSAFVKKRCIYDNFLSVQGLIKDIKAKKKSVLFIKLDMLKAFDSILLQRLGFGARWREWTTVTVLSHPFASRLSAVSTISCSVVHGNKRAFGSTGAFHKSLGVELAHDFRKLYLICRVCSVFVGH